MSPFVAIGVVLGWVAGPRVLRALSGVSRPYASTYSEPIETARPYCEASVTWQGRTLGVFVAGRSR